MDRHTGRGSQEIPGLWLESAWFAGSGPMGAVGTWVPCQVRAVIAHLMSTVRAPPASQWDSVNKGKGHLWGAWAPWHRGMMSVSSSFLLGTILPSFQRAIVIPSEPCDEAAKLAGLASLWGSRKPDLRHWWHNPRNVTRTTALSGLYLKHSDPTT